MASVDIGIAEACEKGFGFLMLHYCVFTVIMFIISAVALFIYDFCTKRLFDKLNRFEIPYQIEQ